jgi:hypothetical protein
MVSVPVLETEGRLRRRAKWCADLSENTRRRIAILSQVPPVSTLSFVRKGRGKARVGDQILSENLLGQKFGKRDVQW